MHACIDALVYMLQLLRIWACFYKHGPFSTLYTSFTVINSFFILHCHVLITKLTYISHWLWFVVSVWFYVLVFLSLSYVFTFSASDWDREKLLEAWMVNAEECCQRSGVHMPNPPPSGYNAWDTLPSPRTPRTTRSSITSPDQISLMPADEESSLVRNVFGSHSLMSAQLIEWENNIQNTEMVTFPHSSHWHMESSSLTKKKSHSCFEFPSFS